MKGDRKEMRNIMIVLMVLMFGLVVTPKYAFTDEDPFEFADIHLAPVFNAGILGPFGGYVGGSGDWRDMATAMDWSIGNTVPLSPTRTEDMVFSTTVGSWVNPADWRERMRIKKDGNVGIGTAIPHTKLEVSGGILRTSGSGNRIEIFAEDGSGGLALQISNPTGDYGLVTG